MEKILPEGWEWKSLKDVIKSKKGKKPNQLSDIEFNESVPYLDIRTLEQNKIFQYVCRWPNHSFVHKNAFESIARPLIYPDYDPTTFQTSKPTNSFYNEMDHWFYTNFKHTHQYQTWQAGLQYLTNNIDGKFFNYEMKQPVGFVGFLSPFYYLGEADFVDSGINNFNRF